MNNKNHPGSKSVLKHQCDGISQLGLVLGDRFDGEEMCGKKEQKIKCN